MAERNYLSIGQVVNLLRGAYPDLSNSKIRFLEDEGLITPHRTPKGYRQYSKEDVDRLEVILHLQKTRYMPLNVIKQRLENATDLSTLAYEVGLLSDVPLKTEPKETKQKLHPIETIPDMLGVEISFIRSLAENDLIRIIKSPQNRELVDGRDFPIIRYCSELSRFHIEPRNLRQYVSSANRESSMFEQVLVSMLGMDTSDDERDAKLERAFKKLHDLTEGVHTALLKNRVFKSLNAVVEDADIDALDEEITRSESTKAKNEEIGAPASHEDSLVKPLKVVTPSQSAPPPRANNSCRLSGNPLKGHAMYDFESQIVDIPDYPEPGVIFKDITPLFGNPEALKAMTDALAEHFAGMGITKVVGPEARGFMVGVPVAVALGAGFVPARKPGKLPRETVSQSYELEYGTDSIEIHADAISSKDTVLILDDLVATGGTVEATGKLVRDMGAKLVGYGCILELAFLNPREKLTPSNDDVELFSLVTVD